MIDNLAETVKRDPDKIELVVKELRRDIRIYFRSALACIILWILLGIMVPSWRQPWDIGYKILFYCMLILPTVPVIFFHFVIFIKVSRFCTMTEENTVIGFFSRAISLIIPFGALVIPGLIIRKYRTQKISAQR